MDPRKLIERWARILAGRMMIAGTEPLKAAPRERDLVIDMPETWANLNEWEPEFNWN